MVSKVTKRRLFTVLLTWYDKYSHLLILAPRWPEIREAAVYIPTQQNRVSDKVRDVK